MESESHIGTLGWGIVAGFVVAWDVLAPETLSHAVDRALERPIGKYAAIGAVAVTGAHLLNVLPESIDPFPKALHFLEEVRDAVRR